MRRVARRLRTSLHGRTHQQFEFAHDRHGCLGLRVELFAGRRAFLKLMAATPLFATMATQSFAKTVSSKAMGNAYAKLGIRPLINARGTYT